MSGLSGMLKLGASAVFAVGSPISDAVEATYTNADGVALSVAAVKGATASELTDDEHNRNKILKCTISIYHVSLTQPNVGETITIDEVRWTIDELLSWQAQTARLRCVQEFRKRIGGVTRRPRRL